MNVLSASTLILCSITSLMAQSTGPPPAGEQIRYDGNRMLRPANYREWVWLSSGLGMSYTAGPPSQNPDFDNVFVNPSAYRSFLAKGTWPDGTVLVLETHASLTKSSINRSGRVQGDLTGMEVHVKDERRFPGKWAFFAFRSSGSTGTLIPASAGCYSCHQQHGAVDTTFVQFYPTLLEVARQKGTLQNRY